MDIAQYLSRLQKHHEDKQNKDKPNSSDKPAKPESDSK